MEKELFTFYELNDDELNALSEDMIAKEAKKTKQHLKEVHKSEEEKLFRKQEVPETAEIDSHVPVVVKDNADNDTHIKPNNTTVYNAAMIQPLKKSFKGYIII